MPKGRRLALVVGANGPEAPGRASLRYAVNDAQDMAQVLHEYCNFTLFGNTPLLGKDATSGKVKEAIVKLAQQIQDDDFVLFFFSGHAAVLPTQADLDDVYLVTDNFDAADRDAHISLLWLRQVLFEHEKAACVLLIFDCCYAGKFSDSAPDPYHLQKRLKDYFGEPGASSPSLRGGIRLALTAAGAFPAKEQEGHGLFTGHLLAALKGEREQAVDEMGQITFGVLSDYLAKALASSAQVPQYSGSGTLLVLAVHPGLSLEKRREREQQARDAERQQQLLEWIASDRSDGLLQNRLDSFVGREQELADIRRQIDELLPTGGYLTITGQAGQGKSSCIAKLVEMAAQTQGSFTRVAYYFIPTTPGNDIQEPLLRRIIVRLTLKYALPYDLDFLFHASPAALCERFPGVLKDIAALGKQEIIFLDGLDQLLPDPYRNQRYLSFLPLGPGSPPPGIVFVLGTRPDDIRHSLDRLRPHQYALPDLSRDDFSRILQHRGVSLQQTLADRFYEVLEQNALYLDLIAKELDARKHLSAQQVEEIVKQLSDNPQEIFSFSIDRLRWQKELWQAVIKPVLGLLLTASEPLSRLHLKHLINLTPPTKIDGEQLNRGLVSLGGLIIDDRGHYSLFHHKFRDYLRQGTQDTQEERIFDAEDEQDWHRRFVVWCEQDGLAQIWQESADAIEQGRRNYARQHYIAHLYSAADRKKLFHVLDEGAYGRAKIAYDPSMRAYALDLDRGRDAAASENWDQQEAIHYLPYLWRYTLLRCSLASRADSYPTVAFRLMLLLGYEAKALRLAELLTDPVRKTEVFGLIANHQASQPGREREAEQLFLRAEWAIDSISDETSKNQALVELGTALAQAQQWQKARQIIDTISSAGQKSRGLRGLSIALNAAGRVKEAVDGWKEANALLAASNKEEASRKREQAQRPQQREIEQTISSVISHQRFQQVENLSKLGIGLALNQWTQAAEQRWQEVEQMINASSESPRLNRAWALGALGKALAQLQYRQEATQCWQAVTQCWQEDERLIDSLPAGMMDYKAEMLNKLGNLLAQGQCWEEADRYWQQAEGLIDSLPQGQSKDGDIYKRMKKAELLRSRLKALVQAQHWQKAEQVVSSIPDAPGCTHSKLWAWRKLGTALTQAQRWEEAEQCWQEAERVIDSSIIKWNRAEEKARALKERGVALAQAQQWQEAQRCWQEMEQVIGSLPDTFWSKAEVLGDWGIALAQAQHWLDAKRVIGSILNKQLKVRALSALGASLAQAQRWEEAQQCWQMAELLISSLPDDAKAKARSTLGISLAQAQQWQEAEQAIGSLPNGEDKARALHELGTALAQAQQWEAAERTIVSISDDEHKREALTKLGEAMAYRHDFDRLLQFVQRHWLQATRRDEVIRLLPLTFGLLPRSSELGTALSDAFGWIDEFWQLQPS